MKSKAVKELESDDLLSSSDQEEEKAPEKVEVKVEAPRKKLIRAEELKEEEPQKKPQKSKKINSQKTVKMDYFEDEAKEASSEEESLEDQEEQTSEQDLKPKVEGIVGYNVAAPLPKREPTNWLAQFEGKSEEDVNKMFRERHYRDKETANQYPSAEDPRVYSVKVKGRKQIDICFEVLTKFVGKGVRIGKCDIVSVCYFKEKHDNYIFVEGFSQEKVASCLKGIFGIILPTLSPIQGEDYAKLLKKPKVSNCSFKKGKYVRVKVGLYKQDLGKVVKINKRQVQLALVPRIVLDLLKLKQEVIAVASSEASVLIDQPLHYLSDIPIEKRPTKNLITDQLAIDALKPYFRFNQKGFVLLKFRFDDITEDVGVLTPKEISYFQQDPNLLEFMEKEKSNFAIKPNIKEGQLVKCSRGDAAGLTGRVKKVDGNMVTFDGHFSGKFVSEVVEHIERICPVFKKGEEVMVGSGVDMGKSGVVVATEGQHTIILTKNDNQIKVLTKLLIHKIDGIGLDPPTIKLRKFDLVRYHEGVGMVLSWDSTVVKILTQQGKVDCISPLNIDESVQKPGDFFVQNNANEKIRLGSIVRVITGRHVGKVCEVKRIHQQAVFLFNKDFPIEGIELLPANEMRLVTTGLPLGTVYQTKDEKSNESRIVGKVVTVKSGYYKGLQGTNQVYSGTVQRVVRNLVRIKLNSTRQIVEMDIGCIPEVEQIMKELTTQARQDRQLRIRSSSLAYEERKTNSKIPQANQKVNSSFSDEDSN